MLEVLRHMYQLNRRGLGSVVTNLRPFIFASFVLTILRPFCLVRVLYDYHSQGPDELDVTEGQVVELTGGPSGGESYAEGWWEGEKARGLGRHGAETDLPRPRQALTITEEGASSPAIMCVCDIPVRATTKLNA